MGLETAAIIALGSAAAGAASTGLSIGQAAKQGRLKKEADAKATQAMADARKKLSVNYMDQLSVSKKAYELASNAALSTGAQALNFAREGSERGIGATAGRVLAAQNQAQQQIASSMEQEVARLDALSAQEDADIATKLGSLDLMTAQGAQLASRDFQRAKNAAVENAIKSGASTLTGAVESFAPLYPKRGDMPSIGTSALGQSGAGIGASALGQSGAGIGASALGQSINLQEGQAIEAMENIQPNIEFIAKQGQRVNSPSFNPFNYISPQMMQLNQPTTQEMLDRNTYLRGQAINLPGGQAIEAIENIRPNVEFIPFDRSTLYPQRRKF